MTKDLQELQVLVEGTKNCIQAVGYKRIRSGWLSNNWKKFLTMLKTGQVTSIRSNIILVLTSSGPLEIKLIYIIRSPLTLLYTQHMCWKTLIKGNSEDCSSFIKLYLSWTICIKLTFCFRVHFSLAWSSYQTDSQAPESSSWHACNLPFPRTYQCHGYITTKFLTARRINNDPPMSASSTSIAHATIKSLRS